MRIIKFDHLTFVSDYSSKDMVLEEFQKGYYLKWFESGKENIQAKRAFFSAEQLFHDLYYWESKDQSTFPVETIFYNSVTLPTNISFSGYQIYGHYRDERSVTAIVLALGGKRVNLDSKDLVFSLKGLLDKTPILLVLKKEECVFENKLDQSGYGCITLLVNSLDQIETIEQIKNCFVSTKQTFEVNNNKLQISFVVSQELNVVFELITPER